MNARLGLLLAVVLGLTAVSRGQDSPESRESRAARINRLLQELRRAETHLDGQIESARHILSLLQPNEAPLIEVEVRSRLGSALVDRARYEEARTELEAVQQLASETGDDGILMTCLADLLVVHSSLGNLDLAVRCGEACLKLAEHLGRKDVYWRISSNIGSVWDKRGNAEKALEYHRRALQQAEELDDPQGIATILNNIAVLHLNVEHYEQALPLLERALELIEPLDLPIHEAGVLRNIGDVMLLAEEFEEALDYHQEALEMCVAVEDEPAIALSCYRLGDTFLALEEYDEALVHLEQAREIQARLGLEGERARTQGAIARAFAGLDRGAEALSAAREGLELTGSYQLKGDRLRVLQDLVEAQAAAGEYRDALETSREAAALERQLRSLDHARTMAEVTAQFDAQDKQNQIEKLESERELQEERLARQQLLRNALVVGAVLLAGLALVGWSRFLVGRRNEAALEEKRLLERKLLEGQRLESLGLLAGGVAHDFNNLLVGILGNVSLARSRTDAGSSQRVLLDEVQLASERAAELAQQMLTYAGKGEFRLVPVDVNHLVSTTCRLLPSAAARPARLEMHLDPRNPRALADPTQLGQVVLNLLANAREAIGDESGSIEVRTVLVDRGSSAAPDDPGQVLLEVRDTGCGMDEATRSRIFEPFFSRKETGRGLGLATVQGIVRGHGGSLTVDSAPGQGTTVRVLLPATTRPLPVPPRRVAAPAAGPPTGSILIVDDDDLVLRTVGRMVAELGFPHEVARDGHEALQVLRSDPRRFEAVLLDLRMPELNGRRTLPGLLEIRADLPVVLMSGYDEEGFPTPESTRTTFLKKPFETAQLEERLRAIQVRVRADGALPHVG